MKKTRANHPRGFLSLALSKTAVIVAFAMFLNIANVSVFAGLSGIKAQETAVVHLYDEIERIYGVINLPVKIVGSLLNNDSAFFKETNAQNRIISKVLFAGISAAEEKASERVTATVIAKSGSPNKSFQKSPGVLQGFNFNSVSSAKCSGGQNFQFLLLFLILMSALPRGTPENYNFVLKNKCFTRPAYI